MSASAPGLGVSLDVSAVPVRLGGVGYYTRAIAAGLAGRDDVALTLVCRRDDGARWADLVGPTTALRDVVPTARPGRLVFEQTSFPTLLHTLGVAVHHGPHYTMPARSPVPCAVTIHDCTFFDHPEWHLRSKAVFFRRAIRRAASQAGVLICVSDATANRLQASCDVRVPMVVAPHGVDHQRFTATEPSTGADAAILSQAGIPPDRPLVVFVGTLEPRKGVASLVAAFDRVADQQTDAVLVLAGQMGWGLADLERSLAAARHSDRIMVTGYLPDDAVPALLRSAAVVAYPSLDEGFGLPALEALACGAPLVTTEGTAMAEMAGPAARLVPPGKVGALADAAAAALEEGPASAAAQERRGLGLSRAAGFTWEASLQLHLAAYELARAGSQ